MTSSLKKLLGQKVGLDTMVFIYTFEEHPAYLPLIKDFLHALEKGEFEAVTSTLTITECLIQPYRKNHPSLATHYLVLFRNFPHLSVIPVLDDIAERAAFLRAHHNLKTPDAIQIATALVSGAHIFLTNDETMSHIEGMDILLLDQLR